MPYIKPSTTSAIVDAVSAGAVLSAPFYQGQRGHPVAFSNSFADALAALDGDSGARNIIVQHADQLTAIECDDAGVLVDIDTVMDLKTTNN